VEECAAEPRTAGEGDAGGWTSTAAQMSTLPGAGQYWALPIMNEVFSFLTLLIYVSDDLLVLTRSCTITKLCLLMIQSLTDLTQMLTDAHLASLQIAYLLQRLLSHTLNQHIPSHI
jgi:hypothetical protein